MQAARGTPLTESPTPPAVPRRHWLLAATATLLFAADLATKVWTVESLGARSIRALGGYVVLHQTRNPGAAFGIGNGATYVLTVVAIVVVAIIVRTAGRLRSRPWALTLGLLLGGALGNLADRLFRAPGPLRGHVVDFIDLQYQGRSVWPVFNIADMAIVTGAALAVLLAWRGYELDGRRTGDHPAGEPAAGDDEA